ncbi:hypothetical protein CE91St14_04150 [Porphyromonas somerae]|nr:hypothetical protein CE91St14_04150 [Porphyromonas somerae]
MEFIRVSMSKDRVRGPTDPSPRVGGAKSPNDRGKTWQPPHPYDLPSWEVGQTIPELT